MSRLKEIHRYLISKGIEEDKLKEMDKRSIYLSMEIMKYAHRNQKRENGEEYANHPYRCFQKYRDLIGIVDNNSSCVDKEMIKKFEIPYDGVQEVCLLHDVIEDSDFNMNQLEEIFIECGFGDYFKLYIKEPLKNVTHIKTTNYFSYIKICMENPISSIVKMIDLQDNLNIISLIKFDEYNYQRARRYLESLFLLNGKYQFIEHINKYRITLLKKGAKQYR